MAIIGTLFVQAQITQNPMLDRKLQSCAGKTQHYLSWSGYWVREEKKRLSQGFRWEVWLSVLWEINSLGLCWRWIGKWIQTPSNKEQLWHNPLCAYSEIRSKSAERRHRISVLDMSSKQKILPTPPIIKYFWNAYSASKVICCTALRVGGGGRDAAHQGLQSTSFWCTKKAALGILTGAFNCCKHTYLTAIE